MQGSTIIQQTSSNILNMLFVDKGMLCWWADKLWQDSK